MKKYNELDYERRERFITNITSLMSDYMDFHNITNIEEACEKIGISKSMFHKWKQLTPMQYPTDTLLKLHTAFNTMDTVTTDYILGLTDERSPKHKDTNLTFKQMSETLGINESVLYKLSAPGTISNDYKDFINFVFSETSENKKYLKAIQTCNDEAQKRKLMLKYNVSCDEDKKKNNIHHWKRCFLNYLCLYLFESLDKITVTDSEDNEIPVNQLRLYSNGFQFPNIEKVNTEDFERLYLNLTTDFLTDLKKYYAKYGDKERRAKQNYEDTLTDIATEFYGS